MALDLRNVDAATRRAVHYFWTGRDRALEAQIQKGVVAESGRGAVTAGKNMDGFIVLVRDLVIANGLTDASIYCSQNTTSVARHVTMPGYFRPVKNWDLIVVHDGRLVLACEFKSQVGSFGNNYNNRCEEALGTATDILTAYREGAFGTQPRPFLGYLMLIEDAPASRNPVSAQSRHFPVFPEFENASYAERYMLLCRKVVREQLYDAAALIVSPEEGGRLRGDYSVLSEDTSMKQFAAAVAGHVATVAVLG